MKSEKISFFKRMYLAITDFRMYPYTQKEKLRTAIGYFFKLTILISFIIGAFITSNIFKKSPELLTLYEEYIPNFTITDGVLKAEENVEREINSDYYLIVNSEYSYENIKGLEVNEEQVHDYYLLVLSDTALLGVRVDDEIHEIGTLPYDSSMNFSKAQLATEWKLLNESSITKLMVWLSVTISIFIILVIIRAWSAVMYLFTAYIINIIFGLKLKLKGYIKVIIYASTLPFILEVIAVLVVGNISETINFLGVLISSVYIYYALRALKLDSLILAGAGKTVEEKIKDALSHAQDELERQLIEMDKEEKSEEEKRKALQELSRELREKEDNLIKAQQEYDQALQKVKEKTGIMMSKENIADDDAENLENKDDRKKDENNLENNKDSKK